MKSLKWFLLQNGYVIKFVPQTLYIFIKKRRQNQIIEKIIDKWG